MHGCFWQCSCFSIFKPNSHCWAYASGIGFCNVQLIDSMGKIKKWHELQKLVQILQVQKKKNGSSVTGFLKPYLGVAVEFPKIKLNPGFPAFPVRKSKFNVCARRQTAKKFKQNYKIVHLVYSTPKFVLLFQPIVFPLIFFLIIWNYKTQRRRTSKKVWISKRSHTSIPFLSL